MANSLLYKTEHKINEHVSIRIPTIGEIINDDDYFANIALIISTPYDMMAQLDSINIDFTQINDWDLFCLLFKQLRADFRSQRRRRRPAARDVQPVEFRFLQRAQSLCSTCSTRASFLA